MEEVFLHYLDHGSIPDGYELRCLEEPVTLNYDQLYEMASDDQGQPTMTTSMTWCTRCIGPSQEQAPSARPWCWARLRDTRRSGATRIEFVTFTDGGFDDKARDLEIFLDVLSAVCTPTGGHLIDPRYDSQLDDAERRARDAVQRFIDSEWGVIADTSIGRDVDALVTRRGGRRPSER